MVQMCSNDKDRFIKLLDILDQTYFGNVLSLNKFHELFKQVQSKQQTAADKEQEEGKEKEKEEGKEKDAAQQQQQQTSLIDTSGPKPATENQAAEEAKELSAVTE